MYQEARKEGMLHSNSSVSEKVSQAAGRTSMVTHQFKASDFRPIENIQRKKNNTGLSDQLKSGIESMSGYSMDDVKVHFNSSKPAMVKAHAYTSGTDIHVAPGQEKHLAHEAWHVVQQKQGRVKPTTTVNGMSVNDNAGLEHEADVMGAKALQCKSADGELKDGGRGGGVVQRAVAIYGNKIKAQGNGLTQFNQRIYWVANERASLQKKRKQCITRARNFAGQGRVLLHNNRVENQEIWLLGNTDGKQVTGYVIKHKHPLCAGYIANGRYNLHTDNPQEHIEDEQSNRINTNSQVVHYHGADQAYLRQHKEAIKNDTITVGDDGRIGGDLVNVANRILSKVHGSTGNHTVEMGDLIKDVKEN